MKKTILTKLAMATFLATGLATAAWAAGNGAKNMYQMPNGKVTNVFPAHKATAKPKATPAPKPTKPAAPKPRKKVNFTLKKK